MRSSGVLSRRGGSTSIAALRRPSTVATKAALASVVPAAARRLTPAMVPLTTTPKTKTKKSIATPTRAISGDDTGLLTALSSAPPEAFAALAAVLLVLGAIVATAIAGESNPSTSSSPSANAAGAATPPPPPRRDAVAVFGASGKVGRQIVKALLSSSSLPSSSSNNRRTVVAAVRSAERARDALESAGVDVDARTRDGTLSIVGGVDVTRPETLSSTNNPDLWRGVSQAAVALGPVFARLPNGGGMGYLDGMTSEAVDGKGVNNLVQALRRELPADVVGEGFSSSLSQKNNARKTVVVPMSSQEELDRFWERLDDVIMGGSSSSALSSSSSSSPGGGGGAGEEKKASTSAALWKGELVFEGGGFCGTRTKSGALSIPFGPVEGEEEDENNSSSLPRYDGVELRVRSDRGQTFKLNLKTSEQEGVPESTYQALVDTLPGGEWTTVRLPWSSFVATKRARFDAQAPTLPEVARRGGKAAVVKQVGLVLSRFDFDGAPNLRCGGPGPFTLEIDSGNGKSGGISFYREQAASRRPACVLLTSAAIERNARIGDDAALRSADVPIVRLNPGGALNWKYIGETALRRSGLSYAVVRATGLNDDEVVTTKRGDENDSPATSVPVVFPIEASQGDTISGQISRAEVARVVVAAVNPVSTSSSSSSSSSSSPIGKTIEVRRGLPADAERLTAAGARRNDDDDAAMALLWQRAVTDRERHLRGYPPLPAPCPPPPPPAEEEVKKVLADPRVAAAAAAADNSRGGRVRGEDEAAAASSVQVVDDGRARASGGGGRSGVDGNGAASAVSAEKKEEERKNDNDDDTSPPPSKKPSEQGGAASAVPDNVADAREWVRAWRARNLERALPVERKSSQK